MKFYNSTLRGESNSKGINLQLFADKGEEDNEDIENEDIDNKDNEEEQEIKTYTQEEVEKLLQREGDRRVSTARKKFEEEYREKLEKEKKEAERLSKLSADEREQELLKQKEKELEEKEQAIRLRELQLDTVNILAEEKLPVGFAKFLIKNDAETTNENIKKFKQEWHEALSNAVDERIKGTTPRVGSSDAAGCNPWDKDTLNLTKQGQILRENPELAAKLKAAAKK